MSHGHQVGDKPLPKAPKEPVVEVRPVSPEKDENQGVQPSGPWKPTTLRTPFLIAVILITCALVLAVEWMVLKGRRVGGVLLAPSINNLPLRRSFGYLYLPTLVSVLYGGIWTWIDLDVKRLEPYFQLSKPEGAIAEDSVLLHYPFDFLATVPFTALRRKHWSVFSVSLVMVLIFWGLTPIQSGMFAVRTISITKEVSMLRSTSYTPITHQGNLSATYAQSVYNIAWLNETLPPLMTRDFVLAAFGPNKSSELGQDNLTYSGNTTLYSIDVKCEAPVQYNSSGIVLFNSSSGCSFNAPPYRPIASNDTSKPYDTMYVGYQDGNGFADWYLSDSCPASASHTFFVRWSKSTEAAILSSSESGLIEPGQANATSLFCTPTYYQQAVNATISMPSRAVIDVRPVGGKLSLPPDMFNTSTFEWAMSSGQEEFPARGDFPTIGFPDQKTHLQHMPLDLAYLPKMAPFAVAAYQQPPGAYLEPETLRLSYQAAYRLLFARQMVDILGTGLDLSTAHLGQQSYVTQAVVVVEGFAYAAIAVLATVALLAVWILVIVLRRPNELRCDPATIGSLMEMVKDDTRTADLFSGYDRFSSEKLHKALEGARFDLKNGHFSLRSEANAASAQSLQARSTNTDAAPNVRPTELRLPTGGVFLALQLATIITFAVLSFKASRGNGLPLPSKSTFVRQLLENYVPVTISTLMEPFWLVLNRLLCLLQPWEELRKGNAPASRSVDLDYNSLPPQFVFWKALRARHLRLVMVCLMAILANGLAVALSGLFYENNVMVATPVNLTTGYAPRIRALNGTGLPFNADAPGNWQGGTTMDQFYREMSNLTAGTQLPPFTDEQYAYVPVNLPATNGSSTFRIKTHAFGANLDCASFGEHGAPSYNLTFSDDASFADFTAVIPRADGSEVRCKQLVSDGGSSTKTFRDLQYPQQGRVALELGFGLGNEHDADDDLFCRQHVVAGWIRADWSLSKPQTKTTSGSPRMQLSSKNETMLLCKPILLVGETEVVVDASGFVQQLVSANTSTEAIQSYFASEPEGLIAQAHQFLVDNGATWHKDAFPSDFNNYLIVRESNSSRLLDATLSAPSISQAAEPFEVLYNKLFALLIGSNPGLLFGTSIDDTTIAASISSPETRIFVSLPALVVSEVILCLYAISTILLYAWRPWSILPRLPTTIASVVAYFAASHAIQQMHGESEAVSNGRDRRARRGSDRWGYGNFVGTDGKVHVGVDKEPLLGTVTETSCF